MDSNSTITRSEHSDSSVGETLSATFTTSSHLDPLDCRVESHYLVASRDLPAGFELTRLFCDLQSTEQSPLHSANSDSRSNLHPKQGHTNNMVDKPAPLHAFLAQKLYKDQKEHTKYDDRDDNDCDDDDDDSTDGVKQQETCHAVPFPTPTSLTMSTSIKCEKTDPNEVMNGFKCNCDSVKLIQALQKRVGSVGITSGNVEDIAANNSLFLSLLMSPARDMQQQNVQLEAIQSTPAQRSIFFADLRVTEKKDFHQSQESSDEQTQQQLKQEMRDVREVQEVREVQSGWRLRTTLPVRANQRLYAWYDYSTAVQLQIPLLTLMHLAPHKTSLMCCGCGHPFFHSNQLKVHLMYGCGRIPRRTGSVQTLLSSNSLCLAAANSNKPASDVSPNITVKASPAGDGSNCSTASSSFPESLLSAPLLPPPASLAAVLSPKHLSRSNAAISAASLGINIPPAAFLPSVFPLLSADTSGSSLLVRPIARSLVTPISLTNCYASTLPGAPSSSSSTLFGLPNTNPNMRPPLVLLPASCQASSSAIFSLPSFSSSSSSSSSLSWSNKLAAKSPAGGGGRGDELLRSRMIGRVDPDDRGKLQETALLNESAILAMSSGRACREHKCMFCGKLYTRKYGLKIHMRTHTGYKPLKCEYCQRPFGDPSNLNKHIRLHLDQHQEQQHYQEHHQEQQHHQEQEQQEPSSLLPGAAGKSFPTTNDIESVLKHHQQNHQQQNQTLLSPIKPLPSKHANPSLYKSLSILRNFQQSYATLGGNFPRGMADKSKILNALMLLEKSRPTSTTPEKQPSIID